MSFSGIIPQSDLGLLQQRGGLIGGVWHFYQPTKPLARPNGQLRDRDKWYNTADGTDWFWNGTWWLSQTLYSGGGQHNEASSSVNVPGPNMNFTTVFPGHSLFVKDLHLAFGVATADLSNFWDIGVNVWSVTTGMAGQTNFFRRVNAGTGGSSTYVREVVPQNTVVNLTNSNTPYTLTGRAVKTGSPTNISFVAMLTYHLIAP